MSGKEAAKLRVGDVEYDLGNGVMFQEGVAIEKVTGLTIGEWETAIENGSLQAVGALIWVLMKRQEPTLAWRDVDFDLGSLEWLDEDGNPISSGDEAAAEAAPDPTEDPVED